MNDTDIPSKRSVIMLAYPGLTLLDLIGPLTALWPAADVRVVSKTLEPLLSDTSDLAIIPTATFDAVGTGTDVLFVPGGTGAVEVLEDAATLEFLERAGADARYVTSVCGGSLLLAAAGLLDGYRATTHWAFYDALAAFGVEVVRGERVVTDRNRVSGGGVTAGIDFGLTLLALLRGEPMARVSQLMMEYDPAPPFDAGSPETAGADAVATIERMIGGFNARLVRCGEQYRARRAERSA
jgi:cyclohexyl-isocyanide hydratase